MSSKIADRTEQDPSSSSSSSPQDDLERTSGQLRRDAMEQYLFILEYMHQCGALWSPVIVAMFCLGMTIVVYLTIILVYVLYSSIIIDLESPIFDGYVVFYSIWAFLLSIFPSLSLARANAFITPIVHQFTNSSSDDFAMIGE
jgi:hypothetical protein